MKLTYTTAALAAAMLAAPALGQVTVIENNFVNGNPLEGAGPLESPFFTTSSGSGLASDNGTPGVLDFASGTSGRSIHTLFAPVTLANVGDNITASFSFTTPASIGTDENNGFRVGLFNSLGRALNEDISSSSGTPNPLLDGLPGFSADFDVNDQNDDGEADDRLQIRQSDPTNTVGRLLTTTGGFNTVEEVNTPGADNGFVANTDFSGTLSITLIDATTVEISSELANASITTTATPDSLAFDFLGFAVSGGAFGSVNDAGVADNGIDFTNVSVTFTPVPEPASMAMLAGGAMMLAGRRRKG